MAYFIFTNNNGPGNLFKIAANDSDKSALHFVDKDVRIKDVSESDFLKVKSGQSEVYLDGDNLSYSDAQMLFEESTHLQENINAQIKICNDFINDERNSSNSMLSQVTNYRDMCEGFDVSTVTFPLEKSWEKYCSDNGITFLHSLQIP